MDFFIFFAGPSYITGFETFNGFIYDTSQTIPQAFVSRWMSKEKMKRSFQVRLVYEKKPETWKLMFTRYQ